ncbi:hypothetical protein QE152_g10813 [Popillia japonica]|uniref:Uncharacterized protein n=1 Tax=Popillia japonica TaxID=7064 RepID=A0AAW1LU45_POPJA
MRYGDKDYEETLLGWADECDSELSEKNEISDNEATGIVNPSDQDSDFELESNSSDSGSEEDRSSEQICGKYKMTVLLFGVVLFGKKSEPPMGNLYVATLSAQHLV